MLEGRRYDAVVVGSGPNGLAAAIELARAGRSVLVLEAASTVGGGTRSAQLTLPGFVHDVCSAIHPTGIGSPYFRTLPLEEHGLRWAHPAAPVAHPLDDGSVVMLERSLEATAEALGPDGRAYRRILGPLVRDIEDLLADLLGPVIRIPRHPVKVARATLPHLRSLSGRMRSAFPDGRGAAMLGAIGAHAMLPLDRFPASVPATLMGLLFASVGHVHGWPAARGGSQRIADALASYLRSLGGEIECDREVRSLDELQGAGVILFDLTPRQVLRICGEELPGRYRRRLERFDYGAGSFKVDWALDGPVPWKAEEVLRAGTVHLVGSLEELVVSEETVYRGGIPERPFMIVAQQSLFDPTRAPEGKQAVWGYCHVPSGCTVDMTEAMELQVERFAPGFRDRILARHVSTPADLEAYNANYVGGDINGGRQDLWQHVFRPLAKLDPYATPNPRLFLCSSSTPPGGGVHGMCGYHAARSVLRRRR